MMLRLLLLPTTARDAQLSQDILSRAGLSAQVCVNLNELCREIAAGPDAGAILLTDTMLGRGEPARLAAALEAQPPWSDVPVILLSPLGPDSPTAVWAMSKLSNVTVLDQPVRVMTLVSALRTAVKARLRQYELRDRLESLRQSDKQKDEFLATLSHELRNPLAPIRNSLNIMRLGGAEQETRARVLATMERQVSHLMRLVDDLLELSRIKRGRIELRKQRLALSDLLRGAVETSAPVMEAAKIEFTFDEPAEPILLDADPVRITQIIANLLNNAAKYTPPGGKVSLTSRLEGATAVITVRDTGIGIAPEMLNQIFELFVQGQTPDWAAPGLGARAKQGLGIGLTLVKRLVELHGGRVEARSAGQDQGSEFVVQLPALADQRRSLGERDRDAFGARAPERRRGKASGSRILLVDDHQDAADSLAELLRMIGYHVDVAYDGPSGLNAALALRPDVALLDIGMPGMDGFELATEMRRQPGLQHIRLIALTGYGRDEDRRRSREAGFNGHLVKPVDVDALEALLTATATPQHAHENN